jgi:hypothetical protein
MKFFGKRVVVGLFPMLLLVSCMRGGSSDANQTAQTEDMFRPSDEMCDGTLREPGLTDLRALIEQNEGPVEIGEFGELKRRASNVEDYIATLISSDSVDVGYFCRLYSPGHIGSPFALISFGWERFPVSNSDLPNTSVMYETGEFAYVDGSSPATIGFRCPVDKSKEDYFLSSRLFTLDLLGGYDLRMSVINSVSRSIAEELDCLDEAELSEGAPEPTIE